MHKKQIYNRRIHSLKNKEEGQVKKPSRQGTLTGCQVQRKGQVITLKIVKQMSGTHTLLYRKGQVRILRESKGARDTH